jgi:tRNA G18 (ribose-2'-O)-methylase SpoU
MTDEDTLKANFNVHDRLKHLSVAELREINEADRLPFAVCAFNVAGDLNIGVMLRTACLMGAERFLVLGKRHFDRRSCVGSYNYIPVDRIGSPDLRSGDYTISPEQFKEVMAQYNYTPVFIETGGGTIEDIDVSVYNTTKPCLILGSESHGIPDDIIGDSPRYSIPQLGVIRSLNVSSAAAIAMWEFNKRFRSV